MEKRLIKSLDREISLLGFGLMRLPRLNPESPAINYPAAEEMIDLALENGVNYFDTGWFYHDGLSEPFAGQALSRHPRNSYYLATKLPAWLAGSLDEAKKIFSEQLSRLKTDRLDFYLFHNLTPLSLEIIGRLGLYDYLAGLKEEKVIGRLGFSMHAHPGHLKTVLDRYRFDFGQIQLNYVDWESLQAREMYGLLQSRGLPVAVMEPVRGGGLSSLPPAAAGKLRRLEPEASQASWALRFAASLPGVMTVLSGMSTLEQLKDNLKTFNDFKPLSLEEQSFLLGDIVSDFQLANAVPCTGCRYCMDCPSGVNIPLNFACYNEYRFRASQDPARESVFFGLYYATLTEPEKAANCVGCGECQSRCPQNIEIPDLMKEISSLAGRT
ncbi:MAG: aldo/keto reductase [Deltaproteobacteria bacterium]|jgi:predicted aldo/keto reductase-like oxidoreductase|nr:aldo/keto reductase [Deltaproteobacteria bacterium]